MGTLSRIILNRTTLLLRGTLLCALLASLPGTAIAQLDETWTVKVGGRTVRVRPDGTFRVPNVSAPDLFGPGGPGTNSDNVSDDTLRLAAVGIGFAGTTRYAISELFRITSGERYDIRRLRISSFPLGFLESARVATVERVLLSGETLQLEVLGRSPDGQDLDISAATLGTTYRTSSPDALTVTENGLVTARASGAAVVTITNTGTTTAALFRVVSATMSVTIEGFVRLDVGDVAANAIVRTSLGGNVRADADGFFSLTLEIPAGSALSVLVSLELDGAAFAASVADVVPSPGEIFDVGIIELEPVSSGGGRLFPVAELPVSAGGASSTFIVTADIDNNDTGDLVVATTAGISVHLGNGDGTFEVPTDIGIAGGSRHIAVGDLDGDGSLDIVSPRTCLTVLLGRGDGNFDGFDLGPGLAGFPVLADLNGDENVDLVTAGFTTTATVLLGNGDGTFTSTPGVALAGPGANGSSTSTIATGDLDGDDVPDLAVAEMAGGLDPSSIALFAGDGAGDFGLLGRVEPQGIVTSMVLVDVDGDDDLDLAAATTFAPGTTEGRIAVFTNDGAGAFAAPTFLAGGTQGDFLPYLTAHDLDLDGATELITAQIAGFSVFRGLGDGSFAPGRSYAAATPVSVALGDLDGDDIPDLAVQAARSIPLFSGAGDASFHEHSTFPVGQNPTELVAADLDEDGLLDVVTADERDDTVTILPGDGKGAFGESVTLDVGSGPVDLAVADLNGDGRLDIVTPNSFDCDVSVLLRTKDGTYGPATSFAAGNEPNSVAIADLDRDGNLDIVSTSACDAAVAVLLGAGDGTFGKASFVAAGDTDSNLDVQVADLDRDGNPDIVVAIESRDLSILRGTGKGAFAKEELIRTARGVARIVLDDVDGDSLVDIVSTARGGVSLLRGLGDGTFSPMEMIPSLNGQDSEALATADLDGDGAVEIIGTGRSGNVAVFFNNGKGLFTRSALFATGGDPEGVVAADLDGDGDVDVITVNRQSDDISVLLNRTRR